MKITLDKENDQAYIYIANVIEDGQVEETIPAECPAGSGYVFLDFDSRGRLLGIEITGASKILPDFSP